MLSPLEIELVEDSVSFLDEILRDKLPLRNKTEHHDEARIRKVADEEGRKCRLRLIQKLNEASEIDLGRTGVVMNDFCTRIQNLVEDYVVQNNAARSYAVSFLKHRAELIYQDLQISLQEKLIINPDMEVQLVECLCKQETESAMKYFQIWKHTNVSTFEEMKIKLEHKLCSLQGELVNKQRHHLNKHTEAGTSTKNKNTGVHLEHHAVQEAESSDLPSLHEPDELGYVPFLKAILEGHSPSHIEKMLDEGADPNVKTKDGHELNAAHVVIFALIRKKFQPPAALKILDLLVSKGFNLINEKTSGGLTPLCLAAEYHDLDEQLVLWFHLNGADFNAVENEFGCSVLLHAVYSYQPVRLLKTLINCGANPNQTNKYGDNVLHISSYFGHDAALEHFIDQFDVNAMNKAEETCLSLLFAREDIDYDRCLLVLLRKRAHFRCGCKQGCSNVLQHWIIHGTVNPFPSLWRRRNSLPITEDFASETLTFFLREIRILQKFLLSFSRRENENCANFLMFLMENTHGKLLFSKDAKLKEQSRQDIEKVILTREFCLKLKSTRVLPWKGERISLHAATSLKWDFLTEDGIMSYPTEVVISCQLACRDYIQFVKLGLAVVEAASEHDVHHAEGKPVRSTCRLQ